MKLIKSGTISRSQLHHKKKYKDVTPCPTQKDFNKMYDDIETKKQRKPVCVDEDFNIIDGYTRDEILGKQRIDEIEFEQWEFESEEEKLDYINSMNVKRRHLSEYQKYCKKSELGITETGNTLFGDWWSLWVEPMHNSNLTYKKFTRANFEKSMAKAQKWVKSHKKKIHFSYPKIQWFEGIEN